MKLVNFFFLIALFTLTNCSNRNAQDDVIINCISNTIADQKKWIAALQNFHAQNENSQEELRRIFGSCFQ